MRPIALLVTGLALFAGPALAEAPFLVKARTLPDEKAVFATVESQNVVPARARIGGTVVELSVRDGDEVQQGRTLALVGDDKLRLQLTSLDAQITGLRSQLAQAQVEFGRVDTLARTGAASRQQQDLARTALEVASSALAARTAERAVVAQQMSEGAVLAPTSGRVLQVPVTKGTVMMPGETVAQIAEGNFVLRLSVPERHARFLRAGDPVRLDGADLGSEGPVFGKIVLVYPQIQEGRVLADATVAGIGSYFVGQRVRVWVAAGDRTGTIVPANYVTTRFGLSYVHRRAADGEVLDIPVQLGRDMPLPGLPDGVEVLSGLSDGDALVLP